MVFIAFCIFLLAIPYIGIMVHNHHLRNEEDLVHFLETADTWKNSSWEILERYKENLPDRLPQTKAARWKTENMRVNSVALHVFVFAICMIWPDYGEYAVLFIVVSLISHGFFFDHLLDKEHEAWKEKSNTYQSIVNDIAKVIDEKKPVYAKYEWLQDVERGDMIHMCLVAQHSLLYADSHLVAIGNGRTGKAYRLPAFFLGLRSLRGTKIPYAKVAVFGVKFDPFHNRPRFHNLEDVDGGRVEWEQYNIYTLWIHPKWIELFTAGDFNDPEQAIAQSRVINKEFDQCIIDRPVAFGFDINMLKSLKLHENVNPKYYPAMKRKYEMLTASSNRGPVEIEQDREQVYKKKHGLLLDEKADISVSSTTQRVSN